MTNDREKYQVKSNCSQSYRYTDGPTSSCSVKYESMVIEYS